VQPAGTIAYQPAEISRLARSKLSPFILPLDVVSEVRANLSAHLSDSHPGYDIASHGHLVAGRFYDDTAYTVQADDDRIYITVKFPITMLNSKLDVYEMRSIPIPVNNSSPHATIIKHLPAYLAIEHNGNYFAELTTQQYASCHGSFYRQCPFILPLTAMTTDSCTISLFNQNKRAIAAQCDTELILHALTPTIYPLSESTILLSHIDSVTFDCKGPPARHYTSPGCAFCQLSIPCLCSVTANDQFIPPFMKGCLNNASTTPLHPVNLALLGHFYSDKELEMIDADTMLPLPSPLKVPAFTLFDANLSHTVAADTAASLNVRKLAGLIRDKQPLYQSIIDPLFDKQLQELESPSTDWTFVGLCYSIGLLGFLFILVMFLFYKFIQVNAALERLIALVVINPKDPALLPPPPENL